MWRCKRVILSYAASYEQLAKACASKFQHKMVFHVGHRVGGAPSNEACVPTGTKHVYYRKAPSSEGVGGMAMKVSYRLKTHWLIRTHAEERLTTLNLARVDVDYIVGMLHSTRTIERLVSTSI